MVKAGDIVKVKVLEVDVPRKRISFTMRLDDTPTQANGANQKQGNRNSGQGANNPSNKGSARNQSRGNGQNRGGQARSNEPQNSAMGNAFADAFAKAKK